MGKIIKGKETIATEVLQMINASKKDSNIQLPNAIMVKSKDRSISDELINWTLQVVKILIYK